MTTSPPPPSSEHDVVNDEPANPNAPVTARIRYLEEWIRDCQRYNRNVSADNVRLLAQNHDLHQLLDAKNAELGRLGSGSR